MIRNVQETSTHWIGLIIVIFSFCIINQSPAQEKALLTIDDAIAIALEKSYSIKSLKLSLVAAEENLVAAKGRFRTNADFSLDTPSWIEMVSEIQRPNALPVFNTTGTLKYQAALAINQPLPTDGKLSLQSQLYKRDVSVYRADLGYNEKRNDFWTSVSLQFHQPLFTINRLKLGLKNAELSFERTSKRFKRTELDIVYAVTQSFFRLYRVTRELEIAQENVKQQQDLYELAEKKFKAGLIPEVEALQMEVDLAQAKDGLLSAGAALQRSRDSFKQLIGLKLEDNVGVKTDFAFEHFDVDFTKAVDEAIRNRSEIREGEIDIALAEINVKEADARSEIRGDVRAFYDLTGVSDPTMEYGSGVQQLFESSLDDMERRPRNRGVIFTLSVPLWDWGVNAAEVAAAEAALRDTELALDEQKKTVVREVHEVIGRLKESESRLEVLKKNQDVAQRTFDISMKRFDNGDITTQELALDRNRLTQAKLSYLDAYISYKLAVADLKRKTMWDFEAGHSLVEE